MSESVAGTGDRALDRLVTLESRSCISDSVRPLIASAAWLFVRAVLFETAATGDVAAELKEYARVIPAPQQIPHASLW
jgi:hypothetical protein